VAQWMTGKAVMLSIGRFQDLALPGRMWWTMDSVSVVLILWTSSPTVVRNVQDMARVARWMAGKAVGLVLSGGGSRGLAHLGVLHALDDAGVPIDVIGGTSQVNISLAPWPADRNICSISEHADVSSPLFASHDSLSCAEA